MISLTDLETLRVWMRANGVVRASVGDVSLELSTQSAAPVIAEPFAPMTEADAAKASKRERDRHDAILFAHVYGPPTDIE